MNKDTDFPLVSAIITTHNRLELLKRAIQSVNNQTYPNIELIVVSDNSNDGTNEWLEKNNIKKILISEQNSKGGNYARNLGIKASNGFFIAFLDDDDYWMKDKIMKQVETIQKSGNGFVHCGIQYEYIYEDNNKLEDDNPKVFIGNTHEGDLSRVILYQITALTSSILVKREILELCGYFDENCKFWQEYELTIRIAQKTNFDYIKEPLFVYRINKQDKNRLSNKFFEWKNSVKYIHHKHHNLYRKLNFYEKFRTKLSYQNEKAKRSKLAQLNSLNYKIERFLTYSFTKTLSSIFHILKRNF